MAILKSPTLSCGRVWRVTAFTFVCFLAATVWTFWYAMNSDRDDIHALLTQLIPAGHCACQSSTVFECASCLTPQKPAHRQMNTSTSMLNVHDEGMLEAQCNISFPGLFEDINRGREYWSQTDNITSDSLNQIKIVNGLTRTMIYNGHLYIISTKSKGEDHRRKMIATLSSIHRALAAFPERTKLPNIEFVFSVEDKADDVAGAGHPLWVLARKAAEKSLWLMPDFGF